MECSLEVFCGDTHGPPVISSLFPYSSAQRIICLFSFYTLIPQSENGMLVTPREPVLELSPMTEDAGGVHPLHPLLKHFWVI